MFPDRRTGRPTIGVLAGWQFYRTATNLSYLAPVFRGISRAAQDLGCNLLVGCGIGPSASPTDPLRPAWPVQSPETDFVPVGPWNTHGLLIANPLHTSERSTYVQELVAAGHPVLFIGSGETGPTIVADNAGGIHEAMDHLLQHGHKRIAFLAGSPEDMSGDTGDRLAAYQSFLALNQLESHPSLVAYGRHIYDGGYSAMRQILNSGVPFSAVLASNDESALGAMRALKESGGRIPQEVAIIGFDNRLEGAVHQPGLSSIHVPLFNIGYQALKKMLEHIRDGAELGGTMKVATRLIRRASCGCGNSLAISSPTEADTKSQLVKQMAAAILSQAHNLTDEECLSFCERLISSFTAGMDEGDPSRFHETLAEVLDRTAAGEDDAHIWQEAVSLLGERLGNAAEILDDARLLISTRMQRQYREHVLNERWTSSRLSLLTDQLLDALDENQIYEILARYLPDLGIHIAMLVLLEPEADDRVAWSNLRNVSDTDHPAVRFPSREFPPPGLFGDNPPFLLTLVPLVAHSGQLGYMVFGTHQLDLYGSIVQQLGGAFNTARLYQQAIQDRQIAEEADRMKSRFLSTISHELRTPLNLIVGLSGVLLRENEEGDAALSEPAQRDVERIQAYAQHLAGLIGDVLDLASSDAGQLRLNREVVDLGKTLRMIAESGSQLASDKGLSWNARIPESGPWVLADPTRLRQVALNLVNNAIKFTASGEVSLKVEAGAGIVKVMVHDTGLGIPLEEQSAIFSEFSRSERSILLGYKGLGLGLAISKRLVELQGGVIGVDSTGNVGDGSTFYFVLPTVQPSANATLDFNDLTEPVEAKELPHLPEGQEVIPGDEQPAFTILVVDDEPNTLDLHTRIVQSHSLSNRVLKASSGLEALGVLAQETVDLVLLDLQMPGMDGFTVLEKMGATKRLQKTPVIVVTGQVLTEAEMARLNRGVISILEKGLFNLDETVAHINAALEGKRRLSGDAQRLVRKAMAFIHAHFAEAITRREIAQHVSIAEDHLTFCFRQELGTTPIKYLQRYRVNQAKHLLLESEKTITEIALLVGFSESSYFSRVFHRETGVSPEAFRRS